MLLKCQWHCIIGFPVVLWSYMIYDLFYVEYCSSVYINCGLSNLKANKDGNRHFSSGIMSTVALHSPNHYICSYQPLECPLFAIYTPKNRGKDVTRLNAGQRFTFDPKLVKKRTKALISSERGKRRKKKKCTSEDTMKGLVDLTSPNVISKEDSLSLELQNFMAKLQYNPQRRKLPEPSDPSSPSFGALLYLKGLPFDVTEADVFNWLKLYGVVDVILIKNEDGYFTGDAYVRCVDTLNRDKVYLEMSNKTLGIRYVQIFRVTESVYMEYYRTGYRKEPAKRNYISPQVLVVNAESKKTEPISVDCLKTGEQICGTVTEIYRNGALLNCDVYETINGIRERVFCVLKRNRIAKNIGMQGQQYEWLKTKELVIFPGLKLNLYVEKIRRTTAKNSFDADLWREHLLDLDQGYTTTPDNENDNYDETRSLVYLTMDSSVSEDKVLWWEQRLLKMHMPKFEIKSAEVTSETRKLHKAHEYIATDASFQFSAKGSDWLGGETLVNKSDLLVGKVQNHGNKRCEVAPNAEGGSGLDEKSTLPVLNRSKDELYESYEDAVKIFFKDHNEGDGKIRYHGFEDAKNLDEIKESEPEEYTDEKTNEDVYSGLSSYGKLQSKEHLKFFPRLSLFDAAIQLPIRGLILRQSEVASLSELQVVSILELLGKTPKTGEGSNLENRRLLVQTIKTEGFGDDLSPQTLISKGLFRVKQSKKKMKRIINLTRHLTNRKFSQEDLDAASKKELEMLAEESLSKFLEWNPPEDVKCEFLREYAPLLGESAALTQSKINDTKEQQRMWNDLKWHIVIDLYGEQSDLKEIVKELERNDRMLGVDSASDKGPPLDMDSILRFQFPQDSKESL